MDTRVGTCSECGGPVVVPSMMVNPTPHCLRCGAIARNPHGPVIPMEPEPSVNLRPRMPRPVHLTWVEDVTPSIAEDTFIDWNLDGY